MASHLPLPPRPASSWKPTWLGPTGYRAHICAGTASLGALGCCLLDVQGHSLRGDTHSSPRVWLTLALPVSSLFGAAVKQVHPLFTEDSFCPGSGAPTPTLSPSAGRQDVPGSDDPEC